MAITFLFGTPSETPLVPPAHQADDYIVAICECSSGTITTPAGMSIVEGFPVVHNGGATVLSVFIAKAVNGAFGNITMAGGTNHMFGVVCRVRGADLTNPIDAVATSPGTGASVNGYAPGLKTSVPNAKILAMIAASIDGTTGNISSAEANASLTSVVEESDGGTLTNDGGCVVCISGDKAAAGPVSPTTCTLTSTSFCSATIAFRPAVSTPYNAIGVATIAGSPAPDGGVVDVYDVTTKVGTATLASGDGSFSVPVPLNTANRYVAVFNNGASYGASPKATAS